MAGGKSVNADGRRGRNRTCNPRIRNPMLYPFELRARCINSLPLEAAFSNAREAIIVWQRTLMQRRRVLASGYVPTANICDKYSLRAGRHFISASAQEANQIFRNTRDCRCFTVEVMKRNKPTS